LISCLKLPQASRQMQRNLMVMIISLNDKAYAPKSTAPYTACSGTHQRHVLAVCCSIKECSFIRRTFWSHSLSVHAMRPPCASELWYPRLGHKTSFACEVLIWQNALALSVLAKLYASPLICYAKEELAFNWSSRCRKAHSLIVVRVKVPEPATVATHGTCRCTFTSLHPIYLAIDNADSRWELISFEASRLCTRSKGVRTFWQRLYRLHGKRRSQNGITS
jgi:hypothetical protein